MSRHRSDCPPMPVGYDENIEPRRVSRVSALLVGLAVVCAAVTVAFGFWMASLAPAASIG